MQITLSDNVVFLDKVPQKKHIHPTTVKELFSIDANAKAKMEELSIVHTNLIEDRSSRFQGHALKVKNSTEVKMAYNKIHLLYPENDHVKLAYKVKQHSGNHDHGEHGASCRMLQILNDRVENNVALFVTCEFGGIHLGPRRFVHIEKVAKEALDELRMQ